MPFDVYIMYAYSGIICAAVIAIIRNRVRTTKFKETVDKPFCHVLTFFICFCLVDAFWGFIGSPNTPVHRMLFIISTYGFHTMAATSALMCSYYCAKYMKVKGKKYDFLRIVRICIFIVQIGFLIQNIFTKNAFMIDEAGVYHPYKPRYLLFALQFSQYVPPALYSIVYTFKSHKIEKKYMYLSSLLFSMIPVVFGILQMLYPDGPFYSIGFLVASINIYAFNVTTQREEYMTKYYVSEEREKARAQIEEALKKAEAASQAKTTFLSNMSHDIRTPINGIMGMVTIARQEEMSPKAANCLEKIDGASHHLLSLINDVLDMSRIESGKTVIEFEPIDIRTLVDNCSSIIQGQLQSRDIEYTVNYADIKNPNLLVDSLHLRQVLINILGNAVKFTPDGGKISFDVTETESDGEYTELKFVVSDNGCGMKPEFLEHIFEAFSQENGGSRAKYKGTGIGMAISKNLTELMGGTILVESELNVGSTFTVVLPFKIDNVERQYVPETVVSAKGTKVLLVEDNELNAEIAQTILEEEGIIVTLAENGKVAVETFAGNPPGTFDIILMDVMMPEMNGYEATKAIRALEREDAASIPIFAMTANAFDEDKRAALEAGMNSHISKPIDFPVLIKEIGKFINK